MKKHNLVLVPALVIACLVLSSCSLAGGRGLAGGVPGSGNIIAQTRNTEAFQALSIEYPGAQISVRPGDRETISVEADDNLLPQISAEVLSGRLTIRSLETDWKKSVNPSRPVKIEILVKDLREIVLSAPVGELVADDLKTGTLKLVVSGGAQVRLNGIQVDRLEGELSGAGDILASGTAGEIDLLLSGLGSFNAADLQSHRAAITLSGMGGATVCVDEDLQATITGAGSIRYIGNPHVEMNVSGAGSVEPAG